MTGALEGVDEEGLLRSMGTLADNIECKVQCMYTMALLHSSANVEQVREARDVGLEFDEYFGRATQDYYHWLLGRAQSPGGMLPVSELEDHAKAVLEGQVREFIRSEVELQRHRKSAPDVVRELVDGKVIARVLMGIGTPMYPQATWKKHALWRVGEWHDYRELREFVAQLVQHESLAFLLPELARKRVRQSEVDAG